MSEDTLNEYVCGFAFDHDMKGVYLIRKNRPKWQAGKLNGIGGHIKIGESPLVAMKREFMEEAMIKVPLKGWTHIATISSFLSPEISKPWRVWFFRTVLWEKAKPFALTDEKIEYIELSNINHTSLNMIDNLHWLIPLALYVSFQ